MSCADNGDDDDKRDEDDDEDWRTAGTEEPRGNN
jgi:hypothetical protein